MLFTSSERWTKASEGPILLSHELPPGLTGLHFFHHATCTTRLWLFHRNIQMDRENPHVQIGRVLDETTFRRHKRLTLPGRAAIDFIKEPEGEFMVHEVKKGCRNHPGHFAQVQFYLEVLAREYGVEAKGQIHYPQERKTTKVYRDPEAIDRAAAQILTMLEGACPEPTRKPVCRGCSHQEFCWS